MHSEIFSFNDENRSISIHRTDLPMPWINYLSNGNLHAIVSQAGGGFLWYKSATDCRITKYRMNNLPKDSPGFYIYIKDGNAVFSPSYRPTETPLDDFRAEHKGGMTFFYAKKDGLSCVQQLYISRESNTLIWELSIENTTNSDKTLDVFAYSELAQYLWNFEQMHSYYWRHMLNTTYDRDRQTLYYLYHFPLSEYDKNTMPLVYFASDRDVCSYSGDRDAFMGNYRYEQNPIAVERGFCGNEEIQSGEPCAALHTKLTVAAGNTENVKFFLGISEGALTDFDTAKANAEHTIDNLRKDKGEARKAVEDWFANYYNAFNCQLPDADAQRQFNTWNALNVLNTFRYSRAVNAEAPGVRKIGYRDSSQDALAFCMRDTQKAKDRLLFLLSKQLETGRAVHETTDIPGDASVAINPRCDDHLWPIFLAYELAAETDTAFLNEQVPLLGEDLIHPAASISVWEHLLLAVSFTEQHKGAHGLPLTLHGDWNDIINKFSQKGLGESVFCAQQYVVCLDCMIALAQEIGDEKNGAYLKKCRDNMKANLASCAFNGDWFYRCFDDDGNPIGGKQDAFGKIWINSQTWSVMSNTGSKEQQLAAMDAVKKYLDTDMGLLKLYPGFESYPFNTDPFSSYNPGCGENGAVFCHANTWAIIAECILGRGDIAWKYYSDLMPSHCIDKVGLDTYKAEPYAWCSSILGEPNTKARQGNVSHITGTAVWMDIAARKYILGFQPDLNGVALHPCIPSQWENLSYKRAYRGSMVEVKIHNPQKQCSGFTRMTVDGVAYKTPYIPKTVFENKSTVRIEYEL